MKLFKKSFTIFLFATGCAWPTWAQPSRSASLFLSRDCLDQEMRDNEFAYSGRPEGNFYCNPLMLEIKKKK